MPKAVIFDLDGTLLDSVGLIIDSWYEALSCVGVRTPKKVILGLEGVPADEKALLLLPRKKWGEIDGLLAIRRCVEMRDFSRIRLFSGVPRLLAGLNRNFKVAVASSASRRRVDGLLETFGLKRHVDVVIGREDYIRGRPAPDIILAAARKLHVEPGECVAVGDTKYDVEAANRADCVSVAVLSGTHSKKVILSKRPDFVIRKITELPKILDGEKLK